MLLRDFLEQALVDGHQHPEGGLAVFADQRNQLVPRFIEFASAFGLHGEQRAQARAIGRALQVAWHKLKFLQVFERYVDTSHAGVFFDVANDIGQLECNPATLGQVLGVGIAIPENLDADQSHH